MDDSTIGLLIPKAGPRLKFKKYFESFLASVHLDSLDVSTISDPSSSLSSLEMETSVPIVGNNACATVTVPDPDIVAEPVNISSPLLSPGYSTCTSVDTFSKVLDIKRIVKKKLPDIYEKLIDGDPSQINILDKYKINRVLVDSHIQQYDCRPTTKDKIELAKHIVKTFPVLKGTDGEGFVSNFSVSFFLHEIVLSIHFILT